MELSNALLPKMERFSGDPKDGYRFLENFKLVSQGMDDTTRIKFFPALCSAENVNWFKNKSDLSWNQLEERFRASWCIVFSA